MCIIQFEDWFECLAKFVYDLFVMTYLIESASSLNFDRVTLIFVAFLKCFEWTLEQ